MNPIKNFKNLIFILQYIFDVSFFGISTLINIMQFLYHCYSSRRGFKIKLKQSVKIKIIIRYIKYKLFRNKKN